MGLSNIQQGEIGLHIISFNDMTTSKWTDFFKEEEVVDFALNNSDTFLNRVPDHKDDILSVLRSIKEDMKVGVLADTSLENSELKYNHPTEGEGEVHNVAITAPHNHSQQQLVKPDVIVTEAGNFTSLRVLKRNLRTMYPLECDIDDIFTKVLISSELSPTITYLGEPSYTDFIKKIIGVLDDNKISALGGVVCNSTDLPDTVNRVAIDEGGVVNSQQEYPIGDYPFEVEFSDGTKAPHMFTSYTAARDYQVSWNKNSYKNTKAKAKRRKA